jgi:hypothetical protein
LANVSDSHPILKKNVDTMLEAMFKVFNEAAGCTKKGFPSGPAGA